MCYSEVSLWNSACAGCSHHLMRHLVTEKQVEDGLGLWSAPWRALRKDFNIACSVCAYTYTHTYTFKYINTQTSTYMSCVYTNINTQI